MAGVNNGAWLRHLRLAAKLAFAVGVVAVIFLSVTPRPVPTSGVLFSDKVQHVAAYAALALAGGIGFAGMAGRVAVGVFALGLALEGVQAFVPGRLAGLDDVVANSIGVGVGIAAAIAVSRQAEKVAGASTG